MADFPYSEGLLILFSYLLGGIPTGYLVVKHLKGIDIRERGSGNPGTANVYRVAGQLPGAITLLVDSCKGFLPVIAAREIFPEKPHFMLLCGAAAIIGHNWTIFLSFSGGKGVATSAGVFAAIMPKATACAAVVFATAVAISGHISVGSMAAAISLPLLNLCFGAPLLLTSASALAGALILIRHIPNMKRLWQRQELHLSEKKY
jgi:glycerol-3-phosphate acyltransferase PlsY